MTRETTYNSCEDAWRACVERIASEGVSYVDQEGRSCKEERDVVLTLRDASDAKKLVERLRAGLPWLYPSTDELRSVFFSMTSVASGYSYAPRLFGETDQLDGFVIPLLERSPESRRAVIVPYDPLVDSRLDSNDVPSVLSMTVRRLGNGVALTVLLRSTDVFLGLPANLYQLRCIQEYVAERLGVECAELTVVCANAHWLPEYADVAKRLSALKR